MNKDFELKLVEAVNIGLANLAKSIGNPSLGQLVNSNGETIESLIGAVLDVSNELRNISRGIDRLTGAVESADATYEIDRLRKAVGDLKPY